MLITDSAITLIQPDDWHLHLRDEEALQAVVAHSARQFRRAIVMPNLRPPVATVQEAEAYRERILSALERAGSDAASFTPLMTLYLTANTTSQEIALAAASDFVHAVKLYPAGATTNSDAGVTNLLDQCDQALAAMEKHGLPLLVHGEVTDPAVDLFDREAMFIDTVMIPLRQRYPALKVVFEHITTKDGVDYVMQAEGPIAATITAHHLLYNRNAIFTGGIRPHYYCLPVLKRETHRQALLAAATSESDRFFLGTDSAPHAKGLKEHSCGCAGCYTALHALELYATAFEQAGRLDRLEAFASLNGPAFYGLPVNTETVTLERKAFEIPFALPYGATELVPLAAGETLDWSFAG
ncbi:dihydroorotase [Advenella kashmirensis W13003]|uniref:Dihydroorotase n=1 Tax=Advenella kashmirensis W13003 TaxID=1424334 RepID=V8QPH2_9BURK|nr:dihydroorotase [Advenella kashmirensis]ETF00899.1 dihydroorotase [Advenella kashmirensis W13003]